MYTPRPGTRAVYPYPSNRDDGSLARRGEPRVNSISGNDSCPIVGCRTSGTDRPHSGTLGGGSEKVTWDLLCNDRTLHSKGTADKQSAANRG